MASNADRFHVYALARVQLLWPKTLGIFPSLSKKRPHELEGHRPPLALLARRPLDGLESKRPSGRI